MTNKMLPFSRKKNIDLTLNRELSTNKLTPGILKIFGDHVSPGSNYKAVRVSTISTAQEVVREALEKFNLERFNPQDFVLCDVIGQFSSPGAPAGDVNPAEINDKPKKKQKSRKGDKYEKNENPDAEKPVWVTEYVRAINEVEKPLVLQSLWKPTDGKSRRFELRNRVELANSFFFVNNTDSSESQSPSGTSLVNGSMNSHDVHSDSTNGHIGIRKSPSDTSSYSHHLSVRNPNRPAEIGSNVAPTYDPYFLMLKGCSSYDKLVHRLQDPTIVVGAYAENDKKQWDILLYSSDVLAPHCWLYKKVKLDAKPDETNLDELRYQVYIEPANGADITVDGKFITRTTALRPGELITFGHHYLFMFKDPSSVKDANISLPWLAHIKNAQVPYPDELSIPKTLKEPEYATINKRIEMKDKCVQVDLISDESVSSTQLHDLEIGNETDLSASSDIEEEKKRRHEPAKDITKGDLQLSYNINDEDDVLHTIIDIADGDVGPFKLVPAYLFVMAIEHSAASFTDVQTRKLLLKISSGLQGIAWEKTKEIGKTGAVKNEETMALHNRLLPELKPVIFWLTNALQMLHFLQCNLKRYLLPREEVKSIQNAVLTADEELLSVLEEVIMFTFQQIVYHLTKVLYGALPAVLEVNPFQAVGDDNPDDGDDDSSKPAHPLISQIIQIFTDVLTAANEHQIHPQIITQIFAYLFFFCNALLFNSLLEKGPTTKIFRWAKGVQIRGNIDVIEEWAQVNGLGKEFEEYIGKFSSAVALLSTPKVQLMQYEWNQMRSDYPLLNPAQLQLILGEYQLNGKQKPRGWYPSPDEVEAALRTSDVLESFATHPPLMLPSSNFVLDLHENPNSEEFFRFVNDINDRFDKEVGVVVEEPIHPKVRSDHPTTIPVLEIKPIPPPPSTEQASAELLQNTDNYVDMSPDQPPLVSNTRTDDAPIIAVKLPETRSQPNDVITRADVHSPRANHPDIVVNSPDPVDTNDLDTNLVTDPPRGSIDYDPNFADDFKDIQDRLNTAAKENEVSMATDITINNNKDGSNSVNGHHDDGDDDVYFVELRRENNVLGLGLIDGQFTPLKNNGIYIRTIVPNTPAATEPRLRIGDRILSVCGENVLDKDYSYAMGLIKSSGDKITLLISISNEDTVNQILAVA